ncbi:MAG: hypothetical protein HN730_02085, partial [Bdellovibrionales bacterium]|nr:hypothetical protein [Bdellovibrionales bacterium]
LICCFFILSPSWAMIDLTSYNLTESQTVLLRRLEERGISEEKLHNFARVLHKNNSVTEEDEYVPPHTQKLLNEVQHWAQGGAFFAFIVSTDFTMNVDAYQAACPNWAVFNFGKATGTEFFKVDVLSKYFNLLYELQYNQLNFPASFSDYYFRLAQREGFDQYLIKNN